MSLALADIDNTAASPTTKKKKAKTEERRSLFVRSLPSNATNESLAEFFSEYFPVKHATVVVDQNTKESRGFGFVTLADADDAKEAQKVFDKKKWDGRFLRVEVAEPRQRGSGAEGATPTKPKPGKPEFQPPPKLIVRNLPWTIKTSEQLGNLFRSYGKVKYADLPKSKGLMKGFGFVTLRGKKNAEAALEAINGKEIDGRTLAVDWAVDKSTWETQQQKEEQDNQDEDDETSDEDDDDEEDEDEDGADDGGAKAKEGLDADLENFMKNHMQNMEDEDDEDDDEEEAQQRKAATQRSTDNSTTVFVRNLPFTTTDEQLKTFFSHFGTIRYARVVMDKATDRPAGTGFVCFADIEEAKECLKAAPRPQPTATTNSKTSILYDENADPTGKYTLDGRLLRVVQAVNKTEANDLAQNSLAKRREKDKRRLYLLAEGVIPSNSPMFDLLTETEIHMRAASVAQRKKLVQGNPSLHVSLTRLALRNIPRNVGAKELKELARKAVVEFAKEVKEGKREPLSKEENARDGADAKEKDQARKAKGKGIVKQAKIIFENKQGSKVGEDTGAGKSRGYGFVEYVSHHWALMGLRYLNGLQLEDGNGKKQRIIAEFSIENAQVVQRRRINEEKSRQPQQDKPEQDTEQSKPDGRPPKRDFKGGDRRQGKKTLKEKIGGGGEEKEEAEGKDGMKQKLIARKRLMKKKKATSRGKK